jgi:predicted house-cleaning noncanonical NTP pyrophosphatase (MazG superfamily)|tara:strand:+ start:406 stop:633 length:228 start_codon:yes stop_codon:yes gene_type:complete
MDIKSMLVKLAEEQAEKMQEQAMEHLASDDMAEKIASAINKRIDIPFVSEEKEQIFFEKVVDVVTDILEGVFKGK